uniref:Uncharacterized protein n=1 Tax=Anguilla anguilla TaxID=7936 RepID=A0A0E9TT92_ANGAN
MCSWNNILPDACYKGLAWPGHLFGLQCRTTCLVRNIRNPLYRTDTVCLQTTNSKHYELACIAKVKYNKLYNLLPMMILL